MLYCIVDSLLAVAVLRAAAQRHTDHAAWERHKQRMMIPVQLKPQDPPILPLHIAPGNTEKHQLSQSGILYFVSFFKSALYTAGSVWKLYRKPTVNQTPCR